MRRVVVDASACAAVIFGEDGGDEVGRKFENATVHAPTLLWYELQNIAAKKCRQEPDRARAVLEALERTIDKRTGIVWMETNPMDVALLANATGLSTYDASYLWLAGFLGVDLITLDRRLAAAADAFA